MVKKAEPELMQILVTGMLNKAVAKGFSLIELLIVLVIMSIAFTFAILSFGDFGSDKLAKASADQLIHFIKLCEQQAILQGSPMGIVLSPNGYLALRYESEHQWQPLRANIFHYHAFSPKIKVSNNLEPTNPKKPNVIIQASGDITPFIIKFQSSKTSIIMIKGAHDGSIKSEILQS